MTIEELRTKLIEIDDTNKVIGEAYQDAEGIHYDQDKALLEYINDKRVCAIFKRTAKWYA